MGPLRKRRFKAAIHQRHKREQILGAAAVWLRDVLLDRDENKEHEEEEFAIFPAKGIDGGDGALAHEVDHEPGVGALLAHGVQR